MILRHGRTALAVQILFLLFAFLVTAQGDPNAKITHFPNLPARLFFFDDTETAIYHDVLDGDVYVSHDEGASWSRADIPKGEARMVFEHPHHNRYAFVLTNGVKHYRTEDRGRTWRPFEMPIPPAFTSQPLSFHSSADKYGYILYQGTKCAGNGWGAICHDETYYTKEAFGDSPKLLLSETSRCQFAHSTKDFKHNAHSDLIYCVAFDTSSSTGSHALSSSRLFSSTDFYVNEKKVEELGIGKSAKGVVAFAIVSKFAVVALKDLTPGNEGQMLLYVSVDAHTWAKAEFPHASSAQLRENAYTVVESTLHSLAVDVRLQERSTIGTLFVSNSNGTYFVQSLKDTNRNDAGFVDYENLYGVEGVGLANIVSNAQDVEGRRAPKHLKTLITFDDGRSWSSVRAPSTDIDGKRVPCNPADLNECSLHFHSVTNPHNFGRIFSSPAPGLVMGVGSIGKHLAPYQKSDTFLSTDAGLHWKMVRKDAHKYEFGDQGSILVAVNDEEMIDYVSYSTDFGDTWKSFHFGAKIRAQGLTTVPDSTSQKFLLLGSLSRQDSKGDGRVVIVHLDFSATRTRQCIEDDYMKWYARSAKDKECLMGHKQWYKRRKPHANCYVGNKFVDPVEHEDDCPCEEEDYECDYNYVRNGDQCVPVGPEPIPAGVCAGEHDKTYMGSSGYRRIPGDTCDREKGLQKDEKIEKPCSQAQPPEGEVTHQIFEFPAEIVQYAYFKASTTILVRLLDGSIWQSSNEGYIWRQLFPGERFHAFYHHAYSHDRAYLITNSAKYYYTTDGGKYWNPLEAPTVPNSFGIPMLHFHPDSDYLIWTGNEGCSPTTENCHAEAHYSRDNGRSWTLLDKYVRNCQWARDSELKIDPSQILCESYRDKTGNQQYFNKNNPLQLIGGTDWFSKRTKLFDHVAGFAKFSEFLVVAEYVPSRDSLELQVSLDGRVFATGQFPPLLHPETHAYTLLESSTKAVFLHMTMTNKDEPPWGHILKSNSNGTYYGLSISNVNRDKSGYVDFEKMIGLDGIALVNIVSNTQDAPITKYKTLQTRITHNDGGTWKPLTPPPLDSNKQKYDCDHVGCALHVHGYTERYDSRATYSSPSVAGLLMAVGNVGEGLAPYTESDTFLSRDAGFTWEEIHKDAHLWEFGDSGSILVIANDEEPTDHVLFSTDEGLTWREYQFGTQKMRIRAIVTVPADTSRRFLLLGHYPRSRASVAVHLDFSSLTHKKCTLSVEEPGHDDFELWSPSEERAERCLFGRQTLYHRRVRNANCVVGNQPKAAAKIVKHCPCAEVDFECEFNHVRDENGDCVLEPGTSPLTNDDSCRHDEEFWYERTAYRKIPYSSCEDGYRPDRGAQHRCPGFRGHGVFFWLMVAVIPFGFTALVANWYYKRSGMAKGTIRLPGDTRSPFGGDHEFMSTLASIPWYLVGLAGIAWGYILSSVDSLLANLQSRRGYRDLPVDEDAQILRFEDDEE